MTFTSTLINSTTEVFEILSNKMAKQLTVEELYERAMIFYRATGMFAVYSHQRLGARRMQSNEA